jgi:CBS domain-containing protein
MSPRAAWRLESLGFREVYDYVAGKQDWLASGLPMEGRLSSVATAGTVGRADVPTASLEERLGDARRRVEGSAFDTAVVVNDRRIVLGILRPKHLDGDPRRTVEEAMSPGPSTFRPHVLVHEMAHYMHEHDLPSAPITTGEGKLVGLLTREDAVRAAEELGRTGAREEQEALGD